jgi:hypothetical protein
VPTPADVFDRSVPFDPALPAEAFLRGVPAKWCVYAFADADDRPIQLLCVKNLRASLKRRLGEDATPDEPTKRVNYRQLVRRVWWTRVDSPLQQDLLYLDAARALFPGHWKSLVPQRTTWFVHVDPQAAFPRFVRTSEPDAASAGLLFGPLPEKQDATKLVEKLEDLFDLCRYHHVLVQSPRGKACAYKDMGRCPAPCDGSIELPSYRRLIDAAVAFLSDPGGTIRVTQQRMKEAATHLQFEDAGKIKGFADDLAALSRDRFRLLGPMESFVRVSLQRGPRGGTAHVLLVLAGRVEWVLSVLDVASVSPSAVMRAVLERLEQLEPTRREVGDPHVLALTVHHLLSSKSAGVWMSLDELDDRSLQRGLRELAKQKIAEEGDDEGVVHESAAV